MKLRDVFPKDKIDKPLIRVDKKKEDWNKIRYERRDITTDSTKI